MTNWFEVEFLLLKLLRLQPSELDAMEFYRAEFLLENIKEFNERENTNRKKEEEEQQKNMPSMDMSSMMRQQQSMFNNTSSNFRMPSMPSMPSMPGF